MKRSSVGIQKEPDIMIIPMIDIVFFLLVFFMMSTLYMNTEEQIPLNLPRHPRLLLRRLNQLRFH